MLAVEEGPSGGMGEMFDLLGDMLLKEKMEISDRMKKMQAEYDSALKKPSPFDKMNKKQKEQMSKGIQDPDRVVVTDL